MRNAASVFKTLQPSTVGSTTLHNPPQTGRSGVENGVEGMRNTPGKDLAVTNKAQDDAMKAVALMATRFRERSEGLEMAYGVRLFKELEQETQDKGIGGMKAWWKTKNGQKAVEIVERYDLLHESLEGAALVESVAEALGGERVHMDALEYAKSRRRAWRERAEARQASDKTRRAVAMAPKRNQVKGADGAHGLSLGL